MANDLLTNGHQMSVRSTRRRGKAGQLAFTSRKRNIIGTYVNADPQRPASRTLTVDSFNAGDVYDVTIQGELVEYTAISGDTNAAGVAAKLKTAIESNPRAFGRVSVSIAGAVLTLTGRWPGVDLTFASASARITLGAESAAALAASVPFGRALFKGSPSAYNNKLATLPSDADLSNVTHVLTPIVANSTAYPLTLVDPDGTSYAPSYTSDGSATPKEIVDAMTIAVAAVTAFTAAGGVVSDDDAALTIALPDGWSLTASGALWTNERTAAVDADALLVGVSVFTQASAADAFDGGDVEGYTPNSAMMVLERNGSIFVEVDGPVATGDPVYVELSGAAAGKCYTTSTATRRRVRRLRWFEDDDAADGVAILQVLDAAQPVA